jgi:hypothetical protein
MTLSQTGLMATEPSGLNESNGVNIFLDPELTTKKLNVTTRVRQLYYIYDITPKSILIGSERRISSDIKNIILGWVPVGFCFILKNRIWIEPNQDPEAIAERKGKQIIPTLVVDEICAENFRNNLPIPDRLIIWPENRKDEFISNWFRFPLLSNDRSILKVKIVDADFKTAYTTERIENLKYPVFKKVTLISSFDLHNVISNMNSVIESSGGEQERKNFQKKIVNLVKEEFSGMEEDQILNFSFHQIFENLFWYCSPEQPLAGYKLRYLSDPQYISSQAVLGFVSGLMTKVKELNRIAIQDIDKNSFVSNGTRYFWISLDNFL